MSRLFAILFAIVCAAIPVSAVHAQLLPERLYNGINQEIPLRVQLPAGALRAEIHLLSPSTGLVETRSSVDAGRVDLSAVFPLIWTERKPRVRYAQLVVDEIRVGSPIVIEPLVTPSTAEDRLTSVLRAAALLDEAGDRIRTILALPIPARQRLREEIVLHDPPESVFSGVRTWTLERVVFETTAGELEIALRPDAAPRTAYHFLMLCKGGFYTGTTFHRVIAEDAQGNPFLIQGGDPTGTGAGGPGFSIDFERSPLKHDFGIVSLARLPSDPNSGGSQFFICLSREACAGLDGQYTAFAEVVRGASTLQTIAALPVGPVDPSAEDSPLERPLEPPVITAVRVVGATPTANERVDPTDVPPVRR
ncbi:MAG: peptidylprolyl isomerase [Phycisphaerales bacterium JB065]